MYGISRFKALISALHAFDVVW